MREQVVAACLVGSVVVVVGFASGLGIHPATAKPTQSDTRADGPEHPTTEVPAIVPPEQAGPGPAQPPSDPIVVTPAPTPPVPTTPTDTPEPTHSHPAPTPPTTPAPTTPPSPPECVPGTVPALLDTLTGAVTVLPLDTLIAGLTSVLPLGGSDPAAVTGLVGLPVSGARPLPASSTGLIGLPVSGAQPIPASSAGLDGFPLDSLVRTCAPEPAVDTVSGS